MNCKAFPENFFIWVGTWRFHFNIHLDWSVGLLRSEETDCSAESWWWNFYVRLSLNDVFHLLSRELSTGGLENIKLFFVYASLEKLCEYLTVLTISQLISCPAPGPDWSEQDRHPGYFSPPGQSDGLPAHSSPLGRDNSVVGPENPALKKYLRKLLGG